MLGLWFAFVGFVIDEFIIVVFVVAGYEVVGLFAFVRECESEERAD